MYRPNIFKKSPEAAKPFFDQAVKPETKPAPLHLASIPKTPKLGARQEEIARQKDAAMAAARSEGFEQGYAHGLEQGHEKGEAQAYEEKTIAAKAEREEELAAFLASLGQTVQEIDQAMQLWYELAEAELGVLVVQIAERVLLKELALGRESVEGIVKEAMEEVTHASKARIRINPLDSEWMRSIKDELLAASASVREIEIVEDASILAGCVIETDGGLVDARIENKLVMIVNELKRAA